MGKRRRDARKKRVGKVLEKETNLECFVI